MKVVAQNLDDILEALGPLKVEWKDETARRVIARLEGFPRKRIYATNDIEKILDIGFEDGLLICRLFLALSKDDFTAALKAALGGPGTGVVRYRANKTEYLDGLVSLGLLDAMAVNTNRKPKWSDVLVERLRSGRGSAISGQKRARGVEDFCGASRQISFRQGIWQAVHVHWRARKNGEMRLRDTVQSHSSNCH